MRVIGACCGNGDEVILFDREVGHTIRVIEMHTIPRALYISSPPESLHFSPLLCVGCMDGRVHLYDSMSGDIVYEKISSSSYPYPINSVLIQEGIPSYLYIGCSNKVHIWDFEGGVEILTLSHHSKDITTLSLLKQDAVVAGISSIAWLSTTGADGDIYIYDITDFSVVHSVTQAHANGILCSCVYSSFRLLMLFTGGLDGKIISWDAKKCEIVSELQHPNKDPVQAIDVFSFKCIPAIATSGSLGEIYIWDPLKRELLTRFQAHRGPIRALKVAIIPYLTIVSGGYDNTTKIWDLDKSQDPIIRSLSRILEQRNEEALMVRNKSKRQGGILAVNNSNANMEKDLNGMFEGGNRNADPLEDNEDSLMEEETNSDDLDEMSVVSLGSLLGL